MSLAAFTAVGHYTLTVWGGPPPAWLRFSNTHGVDLPKAKQLTFQHRRRRKSVHLRGKKKTKLITVLSENLNSNGKMDVCDALGGVCGLAERSVCGVQISAQWLQTSLGMA